MCISVDTFNQVSNVNCVKLLSIQSVSLIIDQTKNDDRDCNFLSETLIVRFSFVSEV